MKESGKPTGKVIDPGETSEEKKENEEKAEALAEKVRKVRSTIILSRDVKQLNDKKKTVSQKTAVG